MRPGHGDIRRRETLKRRRRRCEGGGGGRTGRLRAWEGVASVCNAGTGRGGVRSSQPIWEQCHAPSFSFQQMFGCAAQLMQMQTCLPIVSVTLENEEPGWRRRRWRKIRRVLCLAGSVSQCGRCEGPMLVQRQAAGTVTGPSWPRLFSLGTTAAAAVQSAFGIWTELIPRLGSCRRKERNLTSAFLSFPNSCRLHKFVFKAYLLSAFYFVRPQLFG